MPLSIRTIVLFCVQLVRERDNETQREREIQQLQVDAGYHAVQMLEAIFLISCTPTLADKAHAAPSAQLMATVAATLADPSAPSIASIGR